MQINDFVFNATLENVLEELRNQLSINHIQLLQKAPKQSGNSLQIQCPYHGNGLEHKPSAGIRKSDGMFHCFACNEIHTLPEVISHCFGHEDMGNFGWQWLMKNFATVQREERKKVELDFSRVGINTDNNRSFVTAEELDSYRYYHPYWKKRGITDERIIELFDLGYSKSERMITMPNRNKNGDCLFVAKRSIDTKFFHYPKNVIKEIYGIYELYQLEKFPNEVYITESMIDALRLWQIGKYACALNGLGNSIQIKQLSNMPCREFILATDNDKAGLTARQRLRKIIRNKIIKEVVIPNGRKDIGECTDEELRNLKIVFCY